MPFAALPDADLHYEIVGRGPPVILVPGLGGVASYWGPNIEALSERHTLIVYDHRGCGRSTRSETAYSVAAMARDLIGLMDAIRLDRASLLGHSTGGAIGQVVAAEAPSRIDRLVLYASWAAMCPQMRQCMALRREALRLGGTEAYHRASPVFLYPPRYCCEAWELVEAECRAAQRDSTTAAILDARLAAILAFEGRPYLPRIEAPTSVLVAADDILTPPLASDVLVHGIPGASLTVLPYGAHAVSRVQPDAFNASVLDRLGA